MSHMTNCKTEMTKKCWPANNNHKRYISSGVHNANDHE